MDKEEYIDNIVKSINLDIQRKDFLTYKEQDNWKNYITDIIDRIVQQENKQLKEEYENIINRINQGMSIENKNKCLIELGNNILQEIDKLGDSNGNN